MSNELKVAECMDRLLELVPVWEVPVTAAMIHAADPTGPTKRAVIMALTQLTLLDVLVKRVDHDATWYYPKELEPANPVQEWISRRVKISKFKVSGTTRHLMENRK